MSTFNYDQESTYQKINRFFIEQIPQLPTPLIDAKPNCVTVGPYRVVTNATQFEIWKGKRHLFDFVKRSWAIGYALCLYRGDSKTAKELVNLNSQYFKLYEDRQLYSHHIDVSRRHNDVNRELIMKNRLSRVDGEIIEIEYRSETILKSLHFG